MHQMNSEEPATKSAKIIRIIIIKAKKNTDIVLSAKILQLVKLKIRIVRIAIGVLFQEDQNANEHMNSG